MKNYLVEFIGTFFLVLVIGLVVVDPGAGDFAPIAIGMTLMIMVYAGGHISGAHYNPAVTLAVWMRGKCDTKDLFPYIVSQLLGGTLAAWVVIYLKHEATVATVSDPLRALLNEFLFTFALAYVVLNTATSKKNAGNSYYGAAIGGTLTIGIFASRFISGGVLNPAVAVGLTTMGLVSVGDIWIFLVGNFAGGAAAAAIYKTVNPEEMRS